VIFWKQNIKKIHSRFRTVHLVNRLVGGNTRKSERRRIQAHLSMHAAKVKYNGKKFYLNDGAVVIAAITSCTNTSNRINDWRRTSAGFEKRVNCKTMGQNQSYLKTKDYHRLSEWLNQFIAYLEEMRFLNILSVTAVLPTSEIRVLCRMMLFQKQVAWIKDLVVKRCIVGKQEFLKQEYTRRSE